MPGMADAESNGTEGVESKGGLEDSSMRVFLGIALPEALKQAIAGLVHPLRAAVPKGKWVPAANYHVTTVFLGQTKYDQIVSLEKQLRSHPVRSAFGIELGGIDAFDSASEAKVLWMKILRGAEELKALHQAVNVCVQLSGLSVERRVYRPHLTLCRLQPATDVSRFISTFKGETIHLSVDRLSLFRSSTNPSGTHYQVIAELPLVGRV
jgi:2'-5' RNA ligase